MMTRTAEEQCVADLLGAQLCAKIEAAGIDLTSPGVLETWREGLMEGTRARLFQEAIATRLERGGHDTPHPPSSFETAVAERFEQLRTEQYVPAAGAAPIDSVMEALERMRYGAGRAA